MPRSPFHYPEPLDHHDRVRDVRISAVSAVGLLSIVLASCATATPPATKALAPHAIQAPASEPRASGVDRYKAVAGEPFPVPAIDTQRVGQKFLKQTVDYPTDHPPGTIVVDPKNRFLYLVKEKGTAIRYGVGVGKAGFEFSGSAHIGFKRQWPRWTPTPGMLKRDPGRYGKWAEGMDGSDRNPLGARALYLVKDGKDTLYRIHGTNEPWTIGTAASSGCIRMLNQDVIDLYSQVPTGAKVVVLGAAGARTPSLNHTKKDNFMLLKTLNRTTPFLAAPLALLMGAALTTGAAAEDKAYPEILEKIEQQGIRILGEMRVPGGLRAFAAKAGAQPLAIYLTPDNQHVVVGTLVDAQGQDMAEDQLKKMAEQPLSEAAWTKLETATWVQDGDPEAPRIIYTFTDPNCPYCNRFWLAARPWIESGKVQLRHVMVGVIRQDSPTKAAAILQASSPEEALTANERKHADGGIAPLETVDGDTTEKLNRNAALMTELGFGGTPAIVFKTHDGKIDTLAGLPSDAQLEMLLGPT